MDNTYPRTVEELVADSKWMGKIRTAIARFNLWEAEEDTLADIMLQMISRKKDDKNYIERWDPTYGAFSNWVYTFVNNACKKKWNRERSKAGRGLRFAKTIVSESDDDKIGKGEIPESWLPIVAEQSSELGLFISDVMDSLKSNAHSWVEYKADGYTIEDKTGESKFTKDEVPAELVGQKFPRDERTTFQLLANGMEPKDIAEVFRTSTTFVYSLVRKLRAQPRLQELRARG